MSNAAASGLAPKRRSAAATPRARPMVPAAVVRATAAAASGALLALPWRLDAPALLAVAAVWLATVVLLGRTARSGHDALRPDPPDRLPTAIAAVLLASLVRPAAGAVMAGGWLVMGAPRRGRPFPALRATAIDAALPALVVWLALGGDRPLEAGAQAAAGALASLWPWLAQNAVAPSVVLGWAAVIAAVRTGSSGAGGRSRLAALAGWAVVLVATASSSNVAAATATFAGGIGIWSLGCGDGVDAATASRRADLARVGLVVSAACIGLLQ